MEMKGESRIEAPRDRVWDALNDPEVLKASIPGCEELERTEDGGFAAKVRAKVGPVSARFGGKVTLSDIDPPNGYRISGEGTGGAAGFAKGGAAVTLEPDGEAATILRYDVQATVGGKLAQIGSRLIDGTARKMADDFFARFKAQVEGAGAAVPAADVPAPQPQMSETPEPEAPMSDLPKPQPVPRERPNDTLPAEPPAHAGAADAPLAVGALSDPVAAAAQPGAVDRAAETMRTGGHRGEMVEEPEEAPESVRGRRPEDDGAPVVPSGPAGTTTAGAIGAGTAAAAAGSGAGGSGTAGPGGYRAEIARRTSTSLWVWGVGVAAVAIVLILLVT